MAVIPDTLELAQQKFYAKKKQIESAKNEIELSTGYPFWQWKDVIAVGEEKTIGLEPADLNDTLKLIKMIDEKEKITNDYKARMEAKFAQV